MAKFRLNVNTAQAKEREPLPFVTFVFLLAGVLGMLLLFRSPAENDYSAAVVLPFAVILCWAIWFTYNRSKTAFWCLTAASAAACILVPLIMGDVFSAQLLHVIFSLTSDNSPQPMELTELALFLTVILSFGLFVMEGPGRSHALLYLFTTALLLFAPIIDIKANIETAFLLVIFQLSFWTIMSVTRENKKTMLFTKHRLKLAGSSAVALCLALTIAFLAVFPFVAANSAELFDSVYTVEGFIYRTVDNMTGRSEKLVAGGQINNGNNYPTGTPHLEVTVDRLPTESIYLRGFSGGEYKNGNWTNVSDFVPMSVYYHDEEIFYPADLELMLYELNRSEEKEYTVNIRHLNGDYSITYRPYFSSDLLSYDNAAGYYDDEAASIHSLQGDYEVYHGYAEDFAAKDVDADTGYSYNCTEQKDLLSYNKYDRVDITELTQLLERRRDYIDYAKNRFTAYPKEDLPRLSALVAENPLTELDDITAFILYTLNSSAEYSLTPGWTPWGKEIAEYFLFERKAGYCQHFALVATLMYRMYGVPARYVTGYRVDPTDFYSVSDNEFKATVTDASAHAWVEIYLKQYGWVPVEVTPAANASTFYPGLSGIRLNMLMFQHGWTGADSVHSAAENVQLSEQSDLSDMLNGMNIDLDAVAVPLAIILAAAFLLIAPLFILLRRKRKLKAQMTEGSRSAFYRLTQALEFCGEMQDSDGNEPDFASRLAAAVPDITESEAAEMLSAVSKAAYGNSPADPDEEKKARTVADRVCSHAYQRMNPFKKLFFKYIKAYV